MADERDFAADVARYDAWYQTPWGAWADERERQLLTDLAQPRAGERTLDVGAGTGRLLVRLLAMGLDAQPGADLRRTGAYIAILAEVDDDRAHP